MTKPTDLSKTTVQLSETCQQTLLTFATIILTNEPYRHLITTVTFNKLNQIHRHNPRSWDQAQELGIKLRKSESSGSPRREDCLRRALMPWCCFAQHPQLISLNYYLLFISYVIGLIDCLTYSYVALYVHLFFFALIYELYPKRRGSLRTSCPAFLLLLLIALLWICRLSSVPPHCPVIVIDVSCTITLGNIMFDLI